MTHSDLTTLTRIDEPWTDEVRYRFTYGGRTYERALHPLRDGDDQDLRVAEGFWRHAHHLDSQESLPRDVRDRAMAVDQELALERLFPEAVPIDLPEPFRVP